MHCLLDTNAVIALLNDSASKVAQRARREVPGDIGMSAIVAHELYFGAFKSQRVARNVGLIDSIHLAAIEIEQEDPRPAGEIRANLAGRGTPIDAYNTRSPSL